MIQSLVHKKKNKTEKKPPKPKNKQLQQTNKQTKSPVTPWFAIGQLNCFQFSGQLSLPTYSVHAESETNNFIPIIMSSFLQDKYFLTRVIAIKSQAREIVHVSLWRCPTIPVFRL